MGFIENGAFWLTQNITLLLSFSIHLIIVNTYTFLNEVELYLCILCFTLIFDSFFIIYVGINSITVSKHFGGTEVLW